jgi:hypothetical protein
LRSRGSVLAACAISQQGSTWQFLEGLQMSVDLGQMRKVGVRDVWKHEELEFTPWLANHENFTKLADALGYLELQVEGVEVPVGPFSADILAKDGDGNFVVIENQFGKTNHDHLGKVLTYAATLNASAVVWIAERFTDEHRRAFEWLNDHTSEDLSLYAVELVLWQIDQSKPAVQFNVLSQPSDIVRKATAVKSAGPITDAKKLQLEFWTAFRVALLERKTVSSAQTPRPQYWFHVALGRSNIFLSLIANTADGRIGIRVYLRKQIAVMALDRLKAERVAIENEIGEPLQWDPNPDNEDKTIMLDRPADLNDRSKWPEYVAWLAERVTKFKKAFEPRIKKLDLSQAQGSEPQA